MQHNIYIFLLSQLTILLLICFNEPRFIVAILSLSIFFIYFIFLFEKNNDSTNIVQFTMLILTLLYYVFNFL